MYTDCFDETGEVFLQWISPLTSPTQPILAYQITRNGSVFVSGGPATFAQDGYVNYVCTDLYVQCDDPHVVDP